MMASENSNSNCNASYLIKDSNKQNIYLLANQHSFQQRSHKKFQIPKIFIECNERKTKRNQNLLVEQNSFEVGQFYKQTKRLNYSAYSQQNGNKNISNLQTLRGSNAKLWGQRQQQNLKSLSNKRYARLTDLPDEFDNHSNFGSISNILNRHNRPDLIYIFDMLCLLTQAKDTQAVINKIDKFTHTLFEKELEQIVPILVSLKNHLSLLQSPTSNLYTTPRKCGEQHDGSVDYFGSRILQKFRCIVSQMNPIKQFTLRSEYYPSKIGISGQISEKKDVNNIISHSHQNYKAQPSPAISPKCSADDADATDMKNQIILAYYSFKTIYKYMLELLFEKIHKQNKMKTKIRVVASGLYTDYKAFHTDPNAKCTDELWQQILLFFDKCRKSVDEFKKQYEQTEQTSKIV